MRVAFRYLALPGLLLAAGCEDQGRSGDAVAVEPRQVTPEQLKAAAKDPRVRRFYQAGGWQPVWTEERPRELDAAIRDADRHAINPQLFLKEVDKDAPAAEREASLTLAAIEYAEALGDGLVDPRKLWDVYSVPMPAVDAVAGLVRAVEAGEVGRWLAGLAPGDAEYRALSQAYLQHKARAARGDGVTVAAGDTIHPGDHDPRVPAIAEALRTNGYLAAPQPPAAKAPAPDGSEQLYTRDMAAAVARLQEDYGIDGDGVIGAGTLEALNAGADERARILAVNLERRRWLERRAPSTRIDVNTAAAFLDYWRDGQPAHRARVVVGQPGWETPQLGSPLFRLVANPPWTVPKSIAEEEILPKGAAYMRRERMSMKDGWIVQAPGPKSALGLVKFDMANPHSIYLHDTPAKALFATNKRHSSHGCARVHNAVNFARLLAEHDGKLEEFDAAMAKGKEAFIPLSQKIPVRLLYHSAYLDGGRVVFRTDPYGWDDLVGAALGFKAKLRHRLKTHVSDAGP
jgi:murein L,D-transpeptidase YcbB/YkuD